MLSASDLKIGVIGLGYVGLPLATEFATVRKVVGYDIDSNRIDELKAGIDRTGAIGLGILETLPAITFTTDITELSDCNCYIVTVPTPVDEARVPNLHPLLTATREVAGVLSPGDIVIYESTVYPGMTEGECREVLEEISRLRYATTTHQPGSEVFYLGYSPERINPGDKDRGVTDVVKVTSGSTPEVARLVDDLYAQIITAGTHIADSIQIAESAKIIENIQRDVNIALINEFAMIFKKLDIDTEAVLAAAGTKWNFLPFRPGLVGGHCIGVDPYYLTHKAVSVGYNPEIILAGRRINDTMSLYVANSLLQLMVSNHIALVGARILVMGLTFKENCSDIRNSKVFDLVEHLAGFKFEIDIFDPHVISEDIPINLAGSVVNTLETAAYDAIVVAVAHDEFIEAGAEALREYGKSNHVLFDVKYAFSKEETDGRL